MICGPFKLEIGRRTLIMGVLNTTPDSFSDGGLFVDEDAAVERGFKMAEEGADIIDIGGESTRPGSNPVTAQDELARTIPIIKRLAKGLDIPISIDTSKSEVARAALESGAAIVNDISGLRRDPATAKTAAHYNSSVVVMHMKGTPRTMQLDPEYDDLIAEIIKELKESVDIAVDAGIDKDKIIIDPGIGFGKRVEHNLEIINQLDKLKVLGKPILIGVSRKSFIGKVLDLEVDKRLEGSLAASVVAISKGADIIRTHDVRQTRLAARMADAILQRGRHGILAEL